MPGHEPRTEPLEACPVCGDERAEKLWRLPDRLYGVPGEFRYVRCRGCRSVYQSPRVVAEDLPSCYPEGYYTHSRDEPEGEEGEQAEQARPEDQAEQAAQGDQEEQEEQEEQGNQGRGAEPSTAEASTQAEASTAADGETGTKPETGAGGDGRFETSVGSEVSSARDRVREWIRWAVQGGQAPGAVERLVGRVLSASRFLRERAFFGLIDEVIPRRPNPGRALEIGSGSGWELSLLNRMGWEAEGVELDPAAAEGAAADYGVAVRVGEFTEVIEPGERFELIYLSHVLEHLPSPRDAFSFLRRHLAAEGRGVLVFPNRRGLGARIWSRHWQAWDPPRHLVLPSLRGIRILADGSGLRARIHTRARSAEHVHAASRAIARRFRGASGVDPLKPRVGIRDRILALLERALVVVGLPVGEETVVVLEVAQ